VPARLAILIMGVSHTHLLKSGTDASFFQRQPSVMEVEGVLRLKGLGAGVFTLKGLETAALMQKGLEVLYTLS